jgi:signal recognition particle subunit SRP54
MQKLGPLKNVLGMLPGVDPAMLKNANVDEKRIKHVEAIVLSMTRDERRNPSLMNGSRRARVSRGSGRPVSEINRLLKQFEQMRKMMKSAGKGGMKLPTGGGMPFGPR